MSVIFRDGSWDKAIWEDVCNKNEYCVAPLPPNSTIIDIGSHIGAFSHLCLLGGNVSRLIAVECDRENFLLLRNNLHYDSLNGTLAICISAAIEGYNGKTQMTLTDGKGNTGGNSVGAGDVPVGTVKLDSLIDLCDNNVTLLKLDCEGSEFNALKNCKKLQYINNIVGEYHLSEKNTLNELESILMNNGFITRCVGTSDSLGLFWAWRTNHCFNF